MTVCFNGPWAVVLQASSFDVHLRLRSSTLRQLTALGVRTFLNLACAIAPAAGSSGGGGARLSLLS
jgi:hypothetical protein